jgi:hypothetical protein
VVEFGDFKFLLGILFFGSAFAFGFWELAKLRRDRQQMSRDYRVKRTAVTETTRKYADKD